MVPESARFLRSDSQDCRARALLERIRLQLHAHAAERFESMPKQKILGLGIRRRALPVARQPGPANFHAMMWAIDVSLARTPNCLARRVHRASNWRRQFPWPAPEVRLAMPGYTRKVSVIAVAFFADSREKILSPAD